MLAADGAFRVFADFQNAHVVLVRQRVEVDHLADQRSACPDYQLDRLERSDRSDETWNRAEYTSLRARRRHVRRRRLRIQASVARSAFGRVENRRVAFETVN